MQDNTPAFNDQEETLTRYLKYLEFTPDNLNLLKDTMALSIHIQKWEIAEKLLEQALQHHPDSAEIHAHGGFIYLRKNELKKANKSFAYAVQEGLNDGAVIYNLAYSSFLLGEYEKSYEALLNLESEQTLTQESLILFARCLHHLDQLDLAIEKLEKRLSESFDSQVAGLLALILCDDGQIDRAIDIANHSIENSTENSTKNFEAYLARASALSIKQKYSIAKHDFLKALELQPNSGRCLSGLGEICFHNYEFDSSINYFERAVETMKDHIGTWHMLAWNYLMLDRLDKAEEAFLNSFELDRSFGESHGGLAIIYATQGKEELASKHIRLAKRLAPEGFNAIYAEMAMLNAKGQKEEAQALFEKAKNTHYDQLGTTPKTLIDARLKELNFGQNNNSSKLH